MKFINLMKKELSELINAQMLLGLVITVSIFMALGSIMKTTISDAIDETKNITINISDRDDTEFSNSIIKALEDISNDKEKNTKTTVKTFKTSGSDYADILNSNDIEYLVIIPEGFTESVKARKQPELISVSRMKSSAALSNLNLGNSGAVSLIRDCISSTIASEAGVKADEYVLMSNPVVITENTVVDDKSSQISTDDIISKLSMQNMLLPIIVFVLIMLTSQMLMNAISQEKIDKTLETLLSAPVSRLSVIGAKMLSAAVVALINAAVYMVGFSFFIKGVSEDTTQTLTNIAGSSVSVDTALEQLGLKLTMSDYVLVGLQLFFTIMICLSISIVLGALINDPKNTQTMLMPIMMCAMIPYFVTMLTDVNNLPTVFKIIIYAIPFTHTFTSIPNLMFGYDTLFFGGLIYQIAVFAICIFIALRLFMSDKIFTVSLNFGQKSKYKKNRKKTASDNEE